MAAAKNNKKDKGKAKTKTNSIEISENDVLTLKGAAAQQTQHPGNLFFYSLCETNFNDYDKILTCTDRTTKLYEKQKQSRRRICTTIVNTVLNQPACFRMWNGSLMSTNQAISKTQERMRQISKPKLVPPSNVSTNDVVFCAGATNHLFLGNAKLRSLMDDYETQYWPELFPTNDAVDVDVVEIVEIVETTTKEEVPAENPEITTTPTSTEPTPTPEIRCSGDVKIIKMENPAIAATAMATNIKQNEKATTTTMKREEEIVQHKQQQQQQQDVKNNTTPCITIPVITTVDVTALSNINTKKEIVVQTNKTYAAVSTMTTTTIPTTPTTTTATTTATTPTTPTKKSSRSIIRKKPQYQIDISNTVIDTIISRGGVFREKYSLKEISVDCSTDDGFEGREIVIKKIHERFRDMKKYFLNGGMQAYKKRKNDKRRKSSGSSKKPLQVQVVQQRTTTTTTTTTINGTAAVATAAASAADNENDFENPFQPEEIQSMPPMSIELSNVASSTSIGDQQQQQQQHQPNSLKEKYIVKRTGVTSAKSTITWGGDGTIRRRESINRRTTSSKSKKKKRRRRRSNNNGDDDDDDNDDNGGYNSEIVTSDDDDSDRDDYGDDYGDYENMNTQRKKSAEKKLKSNSAREERLKKREQHETNPVVVLQQTPKRQQQQQQRKKKKKTKNSSELYIPSESDLTTMSEYEILRYNKMKRNHERLSQLGLINDNDDANADANVECIVEV